MKKLRKTTIPFRYDLNQIPYDYRMEVTNRFKGVDLIDRVPKELWMEVFDIVQEAEIKITPRKKNAKRQNGYLRRPYKSLRKKEKRKEKLKAKEKRKDIPTRMQSSKEEQEEIRKPPSVISAKK